MLVHCFSGLAGNWEDEIEVEGVVVEVEGVEDVVEDVVEVEVEVVVVVVVVEEEDVEVVVEDVVEKAGGLEVFSGCSLLLMRELNHIFLVINNNTMFGYRVSQILQVKMYTGADPIPHKGYGTSWIQIPMEDANPDSGGKRQKLLKIAKKY